MPLDLSNAPFIEDGVAWVTPEFSRGAVDRAGNILRDANLETALGWRTFQEEADAVIKNWRSAHRFPLQVAKTALKKAAEKTDVGAFVSSRTKRIPAIKLKLARRTATATPRLSQMQDIGGCRAVLRNVRHAQRLVAAFQAAPPPGLKPDKKIFDYVSKPKRDGYRSYHLVFRYESENVERRVFNGLRIEVQIRSSLQHQWATAVETIDFFTGQQLKSNSGDRNWKRFFTLASAALALIEHSPPVPNTPQDPDELREALEVFDEQLALLHDYSEVTEVIERGPKGNLFLLEVNPRARELLITQFRQDEAWEAEDAYLKAEEQNSSKPGGRVVLVSADSLSSLRKAYPNYFLDMHDFVATMDSFLKVGRQR